MADIPPMTQRLPEPVHRPVIGFMLKETNADEFTIDNATFVIDARAGFVLFPSTGRQLKGEQAKAFLQAYLTADEFTRIEDSHRSHQHKWGGEPWDGR